MVSSFLSFPNCPLLYSILSVSFAFSSVSFSLLTVSFTFLSVSFSGTSSRSVFLYGNITSKFPITKRLLHLIFLIRHKSPFSFSYLIHISDRFPHNKFCWENPLFPEITLIDGTKKYFNRCLYHLVTRLTHCR